MTKNMGLKSRNMITLPLEIPGVEVVDVQMNERGDYIIRVESKQNSAICQYCGRQITKE